MSLLAAHGITKRFGGAVALEEAALEARAGRTLGLLGANGFGKSTLARIIAGEVGPDAGRILFNGREVAHASPQAAAARGIVIAHQHPSLARRRDRLLHGRPLCGQPGRPARAAADGGGRDGRLDAVRAAPARPPARRGRQQPGCRLPGRGSRAPGQAAGLRGGLGAGGLSALAISSQTLSGDAQLGQSYTLTSVAAVVIGGVSLAGGRGSPWRALVGALVLGMVANVIYFAGIPSIWQEFFMGLVIVAARGCMVFEQRSRRTA